MTTRALAVVSVALQFLVTAVDPQVPIGDFAISEIPAHRVWHLNPLSRYVVPLFVEGRAWPILNDRIDDAIAYSDGEWRARGIPSGERTQKSAPLRAELRARVERADPVPFPLAAVVGPVSANPIGIHEGGYYRVATAGSPEATYNSFNLGELILP